MVLFCAAIGHNPEELPIAIVNYETNKTGLCDYNMKCPQSKETYEWDISNFSCRYLDYFYRRQKNLVRNFILEYMVTYNKREVIQKRKTRNKTLMSDTFKELFFFTCYFELRLYFIKVMIC
jgi:hypothetical protein